MITQGRVQTTVKFTVFSHICLFFSENTVPPTVLLDKLCWHLESKQTNSGTEESWVKFWF